MIIKKLRYWLNPKILFFILLLINIGVILYHFNYKQGFHSDEQWSYAHANSARGAFLDFEIDSYFRVNDNIRNRLFNQWIEREVFYNYLIVKESEQFKYRHIFENLTKDVHPPLYFILLHTVSSFFPNLFSKWLAGSINFAIFVLIYIITYKLAKLLLKDENLALCCVALWGFSAIGIDTIVFLRMYALQALLATCLVYQTLKMLQENNATKKSLVWMFLYSFLGIFTQYNSIFFSFIVTVVCGFVLLRRKNYKLLFSFCAVMFASFAMLFVVFPTAYDVLFSSLRGKQVIASITEGKSSFMEMLYNADIRMANFIEVISEHFFAFNDTNFAVISFGIIICVTLIVYLKLPIKTLTLCLLSIFILYCLYLLNMPYMHLFHSRYYMCVMPLFAILVIMGAQKVAIYLKLNQNTMFVVVAIFVAINSLCQNFSSKSVYAFRYSNSEYEVLEKIKNNDVFIDNGDRFIWLHSMIYYLANAKRVYITENICDDAVIESINKSKNPIILTYSSYIQTNTGMPHIKCLETIGFSFINKTCASQHCYDAWERN